MLSATMLMNGSGQMRRSAAEVYWAQIMGKEITEFEVRHMLYQPKNAFAGHTEYVPHEMPEKYTGLFGSDDDDEEEEAGSSSALPNTEETEVEMAEALADMADA